MIPLLAFVPWRGIFRSYNKYLEIRQALKGSVKAAAE